MPIHNIQVEKLKLLRAAVPSIHKAKATEVIRLYEDRKIKTVKTAKMMIKGLAGKRTAPQTALDRVEEVKTGVRRVIPPRAIPARKRQNTSGLKTYFVKGMVQTTTRYIVKMTQKMHPSIYKDEVPMAERIQAQSQAEAVRKFEDGFYQS